MAAGLVHGLLHGGFVGDAHAALLVEGGWGGRGGGWGPTKYMTLPAKYMTLPAKYMTWPGQYI